MLSSFAINFITASVNQGTALLYGSVGEIITEKSGNLNLGIPGIMYIGGICGMIGGFAYEKNCENPVPLLCVLIPLLLSIIGSALMALIYSVLTITLRANQNVTGLALTTFGIGVGNYFGGTIRNTLGLPFDFELRVCGPAFKMTLPFADKLGDFGEIVCSYGFMAYLAVIIAVIAAFVIKKTRVGLNLRAVGESPATADAAGINITAYKYVSTIIGGVIAGLGGLFFVMDYTSASWTNNAFGDKGWLAVAIVIFSLWKPKIAIIASYIFGALFICSVNIPGLSSSDKELIKMAPYVFTIIVLIITSARKKRENMPPASLGLSYFREER